MSGALVYSWMRGNVVWVDRVAAALLAAGCTGLGILVGADGAYFLLSLLLTVPLALRRTAPVWCAGFVFAAAFVQWSTVRDGIGALPADLAVPVVVHAVTAYASPWWGRSALAVGLIGAGLGGISWPQLPVPTAAHVLVAGFLGSTVLAAWAIGGLHRVRHEQVVALAERARLLEVEREQRDRLAVLAERARIAREMHDIVAHSLSAVIAQADGGRYAADAGVGALTAIGEHARQALGETRRVLGVLREGPVDVLPQPGFEDVPRLVHRVRASGVDVRLSLRGDDSPVPSGLGLAVYRIVQEGLTNVVKHAGPGARAEVSVRWEAGQVLVDVADDGRGPGTRGGGFGLVGMRERVAAYGGSVTLAARPAGGTALCARIPAASP
ncbi:histidine kinase [Actinosynnema sp. NPDC047251]|uniref:sensor histidine kinase n=1 Tax=Saccharothrix espanaensis TaxID=103731 RepID=UPI0002DD0743|nr:histidine kinase [Saccharothrix espanaensis]